MTNYYFIFGLLLGAIIPACGSEGEAIYKEYRSIANKEADPTKAEKSTRAYLASLPRLQFLEFIREAAKDPQYATSRDLPATMAYFAGIYRKEGAGKDEPCTQTLEQLSEPSLPSSWKIGLLDALRVRYGQDIAEPEVKAIVSQFLLIGGDNRSPEDLRFVSLQKLDGILGNLRHLLLQKAPELENALVMQDKGALYANGPMERSDENIAKAIRLMGYMAEYREALALAERETEDEGRKLSLRKYSVKWNPGASISSLQMALSATSQTKGH